MQLLHMSALLPLAKGLWIGITWEKIVSLNPQEQLAVLIKTGMPALNGTIKDIAGFLWRMKQKRSLLFLYLFGRSHSTIAVSSCHFGSLTHRSFDAIKTKITFHSTQCPLSRFVRRKMMARFFYIFTMTELQINLFHKIIEIQWMRGKSEMKA